MKKIIAAINMTIDGFCDHTNGIPDEEIHQHYTKLLQTADCALYGRTTYQLMEYWKTIVENPTGEKFLDEFAVVIDKTPKIVFSRTMKSVEWNSATLANKDLLEEVKALKQQSGNDVFACSPSLIVQLTQANLIDEYQLCIHPVIAGSGLPLFQNIQEKLVLTLVKTKIFKSGAVLLCYEPLNK